MDPRRPETPQFIAAAAAPLSVAPTAEDAARSLDLQLDEAVEDSFPASDPLALVVRRN